jgi:hypothetical protein
VGGVLPTPSLDSREWERAQGGGRKGPDALPCVVWPSADFAANLKYLLEEVKPRPSRKLFRSVHRLAKSTTDPGQLLEVCMGLCELLSCTTAAAYAPVDAWLSGAEG